MILYAARKLSILVGEY